MSDAIDYIALQKSKAIQYMVAQIMDEAYHNNLTPVQVIELAIKRGMEYQNNLDHENKWSGYHTFDSIQFDEDGLPYYGITRSIKEN